MKDIEVFNNLFAQIKESAPTAVDYRSAAFETFANAGLPNRKDEKWKYTSLKGLKIETLRLPHRVEIPAITVSPEQIEILCVNGFFNVQQISNALELLGITVLKYSEALEKNLAKPINQKDSFGALNSAFYQEGLYLSVKEGVTVDRPIIIRHEMTSDSEFMNPRIYIDLKPDSVLEIGEIYKSHNTEYLLNSFMYAAVSARATFKLLKHYSEAYLSSHIDSIVVSQEDHSAFRFVQLSRGSQLLRQNLDVYINGSMSVTELRGITILEGRSHMDNYVKVHHLAPESMSRQVFKTILKDQSHYVFQGNITIKKEAQKTDSDQVNRNLMLGDKCRVDTKPQIDVFADDVRATHGAAIGRLNADEKFYLESRAISPEMAQSLLQEGFSLDVVKEVKSRWARKYLEENL